MAGTVVSVADDSAVVDIDGHRLTASARACPDVEPGDPVLVGLG
jgi:hypothetical protein